MKNIQKFIIEKVFWWTDITSENDKEFFESFRGVLSSYFKLLFLTFLIWVLLTSAIYNVPFEDQAWLSQFMLYPIGVSFILFLMLILFAFFYKDMIEYQNNRIQKLIPEYDPKLNLDDKDLLRDAIKDALKIKGVKDDEFAEVVRALFLQNMEKQFRTKKAQRKEINKIINHIAENK